MKSIIFDNVISYDKKALSIFLSTMLSFNKFYSTQIRILFVTIIILGTGKLFAQNTTLPQNFKNTIGFIENNGQIKDQYNQINREVKYLFSSNGMNLQLKANSFSYDTYEVVTKTAAHSKMNFLKNAGMHRNDTSVFNFHRIDISLPGANPFPKIIAEDKQNNYTTFYTSGNQDGIIAYRYGRITYKNIYDGIDLVFESKKTDNNKGFEYYFIVRPGANTNKIAIQYKGASTILKNNKIIIALKGKAIEETIPASFIVEELNNPLSALATKPKLPVSFKSKGKNMYGFDVPDYPKNKTLIIDPIPDLVWGTYYGGSMSDMAHDIALDPAGNVLIAGNTNDINMATAGAYQTTLFGFNDALIGKFKADGTLLWMTYFGGESFEDAYSICADASGNIFFGGLTDSKTGVSTPGCHQPVHGDAGVGRDGLLVKFNSSGSRIWSTYYGGSSHDVIYGVQADANGNIFIAGYTESSNAISTPGSFQPNYASSPAAQDVGDGFLARFDNNGNRVWGTYYGGSSSDVFYDLAIDNNGNLYAAGSTVSDGLATAGTYQPIRAGGTLDGILVKFNNIGSRIWASYYGGENIDNIITVACDQQNNIVFAGVTLSISGIATAGTYLPAYAGGIRDVFAAKLNENGTRVWGTYYGGSGEEDISGITCDLNNNIIICGSTYSANNIATANSYEPVLPSTIGGWTTFFAKLNNSGNQVWGTYYGYGNQAHIGQAYGVITDNAGNVFVCGETMAPNGIATCNAVQQTLAGNEDIFVGMFSETTIVPTVSVSITANPNNIYCAGTPVSFTAAAGNGGTGPVYQWKVNGVNTGTNNPVFTSGTLNTGDQVSCTVTSNSPCIVNPTANSNVIAIVINPSVIPSVSIASNISGSICTGTPVTFTATPTNGGTTPQYQWKINGNNVSTNSPVFTTTALANGDVVSCQLTNLQSCNSITTATSNTITINVLATVTPTLVIAASQPGACSGKPVTFTASAVNGGTNPLYKWTVNGNAVGTGLSYSTSSLVNSDVIQCSLVPDNSSCPGSTNILSNKIIAVVYPLPLFTILPANPILFKGDTLQLSLTDVSNVASYLWTPAQSINSNVISNPKVWPANTSTYTLTATSPDGCNNSKEVTVEVISKIWIPNAFSPNNDGINDTWIIKGLELYSNCSVSVFNRYGQIVFQSSGYKTPWNGKFNGQKPQAGTYVYFVNLKNNTKPLSGTMTIIR